MTRDETAATRIHRRDGLLVASVRSHALLVRTGAGPERRHEFASPVVRIGSRPGNDLVVDDSAVSRIHLEISANEHGFRLRDLGSTNGTFVDGLRAADVYLRAGARIEIGDTSLTFEPLREETPVALSEGDRFGPLVGRSLAMRRLFALLERVAASDATVLVEGESGTGKELVAEALHAASARAGQPLVVFDCAAVSHNLLEAELFGHERGAFTGADLARAGRLEEAEGGTLFLDEIGELPLELQPKLLRALERREVRRVGGSRTQRVDVRLIAATNRDLAREVNRGTFRDDLYYRLAVVRIDVPPLRERSDDIPLLVECLLRGLWKAPAEVPGIVARLDDASWQRLAAYAWPGNVRELRNAVERALALAGGKAPRAIAPPGAATETPARISAAPEAGERPVDVERPFLAQKNDMIARFEEAYLRALLAQHQGKTAKAAAAAGIDRTYLKRLMAKYGL